MGNQHVSWENSLYMAIFNSFLYVYQRVHPINIPLNHYKIPFNHYKSLRVRIFCVLKLQIRALPATCRSTPSPSSSPLSLPLSSPQAAMAPRRGAWRYAWRSNSAVTFSKKKWKKLDIQYPLVICYKASGSFHSYVNVYQRVTIYFGISTLYHLISTFIVAGLS